MYKENWQKIDKNEQESNITLEDIIKEINNSDNIAINILKDTVSDMQSTIRRQNILIAILMFTTIIGILYFVFSKI